MSTITDYASLMRRADTLRRLEFDPARASWWTGYMRGLRRAHHGERFGTQAEHELWLSAAESTDPSRAALGRGYRVGLTLQSRDPDGDALARCERCDRYVAPRHGGDDLLCPHCGLVL